MVWYVWYGLIWTDMIWSSTEVCKLSGKTDIELTGAILRSALADVRAGAGCLSGPARCFDDEDRNEAGFGGPRWWWWRWWRWWRWWWWWWWLIHGLTICFVSYVRMQRLAPLWRERSRKVQQPQDPRLNWEHGESQHWHHWWDFPKSKDVLVIRYEGPKGSPGMPEAGDIFGRSKRSQTTKHHKWF